MSIAIRAIFSTLQLMTHLCLRRVQKIFPSFKPHLKLPKANGKKVIFFLNYLVYFINPAYNIKTIIMAKTVIAIIAVIIIITVARL